MTNNTVRQHFNVDRVDRRKLNQHNSFLIWFTGLSGSGKSTLANELEGALHAKGIKTYLLDGDNVRQGLNKDLGFTAEDRSENIRRIAEVANLMIDAGKVVLAAFIAPYREDRKKIEEIVGAENFIEIYVSTPVEECEKRDVKGLYAKARKGEIPNFTGISAPYEAPEHPDLEINTATTSLENATEQLLKVLDTKLLIHE